MDSQLSERESTRRARQRSASLNAQEAAEYAGVSVSYMNRLRSIGGGSAYQKIGRRVTYSREDLDEWLDGCRRKSTSESVAA